jgi:hypothetical protein
MFVSSNTVEAPMFENTNILFTETCYQEIGPRDNRSQKSTFETFGGF